MATQPSPYRPKYTPELASSIVHRISKGENLRAITRDVDIDWGTFYQWLKRDEQLQADYEEARILGAHAIAHDALALLEQQPERVDKRIDPGFVQWQRLKIEGTLKILAKWFPAHYGDKLLHAGHDGGAIKSETALSVKELAAQLRARASGIVIDNEPHAVQSADNAGNQRLTDASDRFNGDGSAQEIDPCSPSNTAQRQRPGRRLPAPSATDVVIADTQPSASAAGTAHTGQHTSRKAQADGACAEPSGAGLEASGSERGGQGSGLAAQGTGQAKRRSRGVGGRGGALKRGASPETGGTPASQILEVSQSVNATSHLQAAQNPQPRARTRTPRKIFESSRPTFPADEDWAPEDYV